MERAFEDAKFECSMADYQVRKWHAWHHHEGQGSIIRFIAVLSVKLKIKAYVQTHKMAVEYWGLTAHDLDLTTISEQQLRDRLKKSVITLESQQRSFFRCFLSWSQDR